MRVLGKADDGGWIVQVSGRDRDKLQALLRDDWTGIIESLIEIKGEADRVLATLGEIKAEEADDGR